MLKNPLLISLLSKAKMEMKLNLSNVKNVVMVMIKKNVKNVNKIYILETCFRRSYKDCFMSFMLQFLLEYGLNY